MMTYSQIHEGGRFFGAVQETLDLQSLYNEPAFGILINNKSPRHAYRFSYTNQKITSNDLQKNPAENQISKIIKYLW
jgi:hypothetical protein